MSSRACGGWAVDWRCSGTRLRIERSTQSIRSIDTGVQQVIRWLLEREAALVEELEDLSWNNVLLLVEGGNGQRSGKGG